MDVFVDRKPLSLDWMTSKRFISANIMIFAFFSTCYMYFGFKEHFDTPNTLSNVLYYAATTHTTTGYGDITPKTPLGRFLATAHMLSVWILIAIATSWSFDKSEGR
jgi:voltage-gated potassium channel